VDPRLEPRQRYGLTGSRPNRTRGAIVTSVPDQPRRVAPLDVDAVRTVQVGTALWAVALVVALLARDHLDDQGREWWLWTCVAGLVLGLIGMVITTRRRARLARPRRDQSS